MVRIPDRPYAHLATGRLEAPRGVGGELFQTIGRMGEDIAQTAGVLKSRLESSAADEARQAYEQTMADGWDKPALQEGGAPASVASTSAVPAWGDEDGEHAPFLSMSRFQEQHENAVAEGLARLQGKHVSRRASQDFLAWAKERGKAGMAGAAESDLQRMQALSGKAHMDRVQGIFASLEKGPETYGHAFRQLADSYVSAVERGLFSIGEAREKFTAAQEQLRQKAFEAMYVQDPEKAVNSMDVLGLNEKQRNAANARYQADLSEGAAREKAAREVRLRYLLTQEEDREGQALRNGDASGLRELSQSFARLGDMESAGRLALRAGIYEDHAGAIKESRAMSLPDLAGRIRALEPGHGRGAAAKQEGEGGRKEELALRLGIYEERLREMEHDPARAVTAEVENALASGGLDLPSPGDLADMRLAAQAGNGLSWHKRKVLSRVEAGQLQAAWQRGDAETRQEMAQGLSGYGVHAAKAAAEIGLAAPERMLLMRARHDALAGQALAEVIAARAAKPEDLPVVDAPEKSAQSAQERSEVFRGVSAAAAMLPDNKAIAGMLADVADTLARLVRWKGGDPAAAAGCLDGGMRSLTGQGLALLYDPGAFADPQDPASGLRGILHGPVLEELADFRKDSGEKRELWLSRMRDRGVWLNAPDLDGYALYDPDGGFPLTDGRGELFRVRDRELRNAGTALRLRAALGGNTA